MAPVAARSPQDPPPWVRVNRAANRTIMLSEKQSQPGMSQSHPGSHDVSFFFFLFFLDFHTLTIT